MDDNDLAQIASWMEAGGIAAFELEGNGRTIRLVLGAADATTLIKDTSPATQTPPRTIKARGIGTLLLAHPLRNEPFVSVADVVRQGDIVALLEAGEAYMPVVATEEGVISEALVEMGSSVGYDTPLFLLA
jgi:acetyl-CoA carboxylase biotin carboxyl carrier protein